jgi:hypothetical protein
MICKQSAGDEDSVFQSGTRVNLALQKESSRWLSLEEKASWTACFLGTTTLVPF